MPVNKIPHSSSKNKEDGGRKEWRKGEEKSLSWETNCFVPGGRD